MDNRAVWILLLFTNILLADALDVDSIFFRLYFRNGTIIDKHINNATELVEYIDETVETSLFLHGWRESISSQDVEMVTGAYLQATKDNVLALDYQQYAAGHYTDVVLHIPDVGTGVGNALNNMMDAGFDLNKLHIIGHSLGGQVAGRIARNLKVKIPRITALDAAGPLFTVIASHLEPTDAKTVVAIHTDAGCYGTLVEVGSVNFFPNFGVRPQPGCPAVELFQFCSHEMSYKLYTQSVLHPELFVARSCLDGILYFLGLCNNNEETTLMGYGTPSNATGNFYLRTSADVPYGLGLQGSTYTFTL